MRDIDRWQQLMPEAQTAFIGDADPLLMPLEDVEQVLSSLRARFRQLSRITCYARASTLHRLGQNSVHRLRRAGLNRVHVGLESGNRAVLRQQRKGLLPQHLVEAAQWLKEAGIELSLYVLLGLGGRDRWKEHIDDTAAVIAGASPDIVRIRRLWIYSVELADGVSRCPLWEEIRRGEFHPQADEGTVLELRRLVDRLDSVSCYFTCDHANNFVRVAGQLPNERPRMLAEIDRFLALSEDAREEHYRTSGSQI
jgi:hypothetical protein